VDTLCIASESRVCFQAAATPFWRDKPSFPVPIAIAVHYRGADVLSMWSVKYWASNV
jgi:hypothetical protein